MIADYTQLKVEVADFIHRTDLTLKMDTFVTLAESQINKDLRALEMEVRLPITFVDTFTDLPDDYVEIRALQMDYNGKRAAIPQMSLQQLDTYTSGAQGKPQAFTIQAGQIELRPGIDPTAEPPITYDGELTYIAKVPSLTVNTTNKILDNFPLIYLTAMMIQANGYVQDAEELQRYFEMYAVQVDQANKQATGGRWSLPTVRNY